MNARSFRGSAAPFAAAVLFLSCAGPRAALVEPAITVRNSTSSVLEVEGRPPVVAQFLEVTRAGPKRTLEGRGCDEVIVATTSGDALVFDRALHVPEGSVLVARGFPWVDVSGDAKFVAAIVSGPECGPAQAPFAKVFRGEEIRWAGGQMSATLDVEGAHNAERAYVGHLRGSAPVAEHVHEHSWELLCTLQASGTFTLSGRPQHVGPGELLLVPPGAKHAWVPDERTELQAVQLYVPPGPEQRFKTLSAASDAGASPLKAP